MRSQKCLLASGLMIAAFEKHTQKTEKHLETLEKVFEALGEKAVAKKCDAMEGLIEEAKSIIEDTDSDTMIREAGLILAAQKQSIMKLLLTEC